MAITIIKGGKNEFVGHCKWCGCDFRYTTDEVKSHNVLGEAIYCPQAGCGHALQHHGENGTAAHSAQHPLWAQYHQTAFNNSDAQQAIAMQQQRSCLKGEQK